MNNTKLPAINIITMTTTMIIFLIKKTLINYTRVWWFQHGTRLSGETAGRGDVVNMPDIWQGTLQVSFVLFTHSPLGSVLIEKCSKTKIVLKWVSSYGFFTSGFFLKKQLLSSPIPSYLQYLASILQDIRIDNLKNRVCRHVLKAKWPLFLKLESRRARFV
jgi:hypothetical protein